MVAAATDPAHRIATGARGTMRGIGGPNHRAGGERPGRDAFDVEGLYLGMARGVDGDHVQFRRSFEHHKALEEALRIGMFQNVLTIDLESFVALQLRLEELRYPSRFLAGQRDGYLFSERDRSFGGVVNIDRGEILTRSHHPDHGGSTYELHRIFQTPHPGLRARLGAGAGGIERSQHLGKTAVMRL